MERRTLRSRLYSLLFRWFIIFLALAGLAMALFFSGFRDRALDERLLISRAVARHLDTSLSDLFHNLQNLSLELSLVGSGRNLERLRSCRFQHLFRDAIYVLDERANVVMSDPPAVRSLAEADLPGHESVTPLLYKEETGRPFVAIIQPFRIEHRRYSLVAEMHLPSPLVAGMLREVSNGADFHLLVVDVQGAIVASSHEKQLFRVIPEAAELRRRVLANRPFIDAQTRCWVCDAGDERDFVTVMAPLEYAPWGVVLQQPVEQAFSALYASRYTFLGTLGLLAAIGVFLLWVVTRTVISPIRELSDQAERLRQGDLERSIAVEGDHELQVLARTMDEARGKLRSSLAELRLLNENLEEQVAARTVEIEALLRKTLTQDSQRRVLVRRLLDAGEEERKRIARELHDEISQLLAIVQLSLDNVPGKESEIAKASQLLTKTQEELHRIIYDLRPSLLDDLGLSAAVKWYAEHYLVPRGLNVSIEVEEDLGLPPEIEITTFRIYQEIITNILRHSQAENVSIELYSNGDKLVLAVEDDGIGFAVAAKPGGAGIVGMRERAEIVNGSLRIDSEPGTGTEVVVEFPLDKLS